MVETTFQGYVLKLKPIIDDIQKQLFEQLEVVTTTLEMQFEYLYHFFGYNCVKDQVAIVLQGRHGSLKRQINKGEDQPHNCLKEHWNQLI
jgi:hypothetical protein